MTVIVGVDGSQTSLEALQWASSAAEARGERLVAILAWSFLDQRRGDIETTFDPSYGEPQATAALRAYVASALPPEVADRAELRAECALPASALIDAVTSVDDLLVVGSRGLGGFKGLLLGSVSRKCLHHAPCPVAIVRGVAQAAASDPPRIVVGVDGSACARRAVAWALDEARRTRAAVELVYDWSMPYIGVEAMAFPQGVIVESDAGEVFAEALRDQDLHGAEAPTEHPSTGSGAARAILSAARGAQLIVVGSHGRGALGRSALGSVSSQVVHHAEIPVVVVKGPS